MKKKNNNQNEFERLGGQRSGGGIYPPLSPPWIRHWGQLVTATTSNNIVLVAEMCDSDPHITVEQLAGTLGITY